MGLALTAFLASCGGGNGGIVGPIGGVTGVSVPQTSSSGSGTGSGSGTSSSSSSSSGGTASWTYMVYMAADNSLAEAGIGDLKEMMTVGSNANVKIVVMAEFSQSQLGYQPSQAGISGLTSFATTTYLVNHNAVVAQGGSADKAMSNPSTLAQFITSTVAAFPAEHYALTLWNHGSNISGACQDQGTTGNDLMNLVEIRQALTTANVHLGVFNIDACLMARYEVAATVRGCCDFFTGSLLVEPGDGDPYDTILSALVAAPTTTAAQLAASICTKYKASYASFPESTTKSAYDMTKFDALVAALESLAPDLTTSLNTARTAIESSRNNGIGKDAIGMEWTDRDFGKFLTDIQALVTGTAATKLSTALTAMQACIVSNQINAKGDVANLSSASGMGLFIPVSIANQGTMSWSAYEACLGSASPQWVNFIKTLLGSAVYQAAAPDTFGWGIAWTDTAVDCDLWVREPPFSANSPANWSSPWMGTVSNFGYLSGESSSTSPQEFWYSRDYVIVGTYDGFAELVDDHNSSGNTAIPVRWYTVVNYSWVQQGTVNLNDQTPLVLSSTVPTAAQETAIRANQYTNWRRLSAVTVNAQ